MSPLRDAPQAQLTRIVNSTTFRNTEVLRRLLEFLAEKSFTGEADCLKEYTVAVDGLGKPTSYDPRVDSLVRIQIGRLRSKLGDYYRTEGERDPILLDVPKGHFRVVWQERLVATPPGEPQAPLDPPRQQRSWSKVQIAIPAGLVIWALLSTFLLWREHRDNDPLREAWPPELE